MPLKERVHHLLAVSTDGDPHSRAVDLGILGLIFLNILALTLETVEPVYSLSPAAFHWFERISLIIFSIEYVLRVWSCTADPKYPRPILGRLRFFMTPLGPHRPARHPAALPAAARHRHAVHPHRPHAALLPPGEAVPLFERAQAARAGGGGKTGRAGQHLLRAAYPAGDLGLAHVLRRARRSAGQVLQHPADHVVGGDHPDHGRVRRLLPGHRDGERSSPPASQCWASACSRCPRASSGPASSTSCRAATRRRGTAPTAGTSWKTNGGIRVPGNADDEAAAAVDMPGLRRDRPAEATRRTVPFKKV